MAPNNNNVNNLANDVSLGKAAGDATRSPKWVDDRLAFLSPRATWTPDFAAAQSRLRERLAAPKHHWSRMIGGAAVLVTASAMMALALTSAPTPRVWAQRCIDCSIALWQSISPDAASGAKLIAVGDRVPAPDFTLTDDNGKPVRLSDRKGKVVLLNFWATWCGGCQVEIPWFVEFYNKYRNAGLDTVGVSMDSDGWTSVRPYLKEKPVPYTIVIGNDATAKEFHVTAMPVTVLIDGQGKIAATHSGLVAKSTYQSEIESLLE
ncbi:MAG TPA: TlpA disulfide reductase family protein [Candidatus Sulfotelmatobacter sp.]|nr:TlpA disulfide reductase family protein [Candidatus Sulfotelmatobacter sp.]